MGNEINRDSVVYFDNGVPLADGSTSPSVAAARPHPRVRVLLRVASPSVSTACVLSFVSSCSSSWSSSWSSFAQRSSRSIVSRFVSPFRFSNGTRWIETPSKTERIVTRSLFLIVRYQRYNAKRSARFLRSPINDEFFDFAGDTRIRGWMENFSVSRWLVSLDRRHRPPFADHGQEKKKKQRRNRRGATSDFSSGVIAIEPARQRFSIFISILRLIRIYGETRDVDRLAPRMPRW